MGCVAFPIWIGIVTGIVIFILITTLILTNRKWEAIKFLLFMKFDILTNDDEPENVDELQFDAFITYRSVLILSNQSNTIPQETASSLYEMLTQETEYCYCFDVQELCSLRKECAIFYSSTQPQRQGIYEKAYPTVSGERFGLHCVFP